ncbi:extracellular solute-binding protein [Paenibacillus sp. IB182496]|uniref:Extracellular solute-binding protein n=1 Tax=Paenibacillus sabuli TaxID=2772509 RepID=A0A927BT43_9BACL|nr:extracellular solute-binding protein [Paenibacillus sabuli]MBD2846298.1 extracellular solute-binding protein [Paenibacillus sabuli]
MDLRHKRGWMAAALVLVVVVLLAGCSGQEPAGGGNKDAAAGGGGGEQKEASANKPELKFLKVYTNIDYNHYPVADYIEEASGYAIQYDALPQEHASEKLNLIMASGSNYDLVDATNAQDFFTFAENGALTDLTPLIDEFGPHIREAISDESFASASVDGKIYGIPTLNISYVRTGLLIRTDWLEQVGLPMPQTLDEFTAVLRAFREQDPGGNGAQNIPFTMSGTPLIDNVAGAFGLFVDGGAQWSEVDGELVHAANHPALPDYLQYVRMLYEEGLLDAEFATNKGSTAAEKFTSGRAGVLVAGWSSIPGYDEALQKVQPDATYQFLLPMEGADGQKGFLKHGGINKITFVPKSAAHPEDAVKAVNALLEPETFKEMFIGTEGETYTVEDGAYLPIEPAFFDQRGSSNAFVIGMDEDVFETYWQARLRKNQAMYDNYRIVNEVPEEQRVFNPLAFAPYLPQLAASNNQLNSVVRDALIQMVVDGVTDKGIADMQSAWKAAGGEAVAAEINEWYTSR